MWINVRINSGFVAVVATFVELGQAAEVRTVEYSPMDFSPQTEMVSFPLESTTALTARTPSSSGKYPSKVE